MAGVFWNFNPATGWSYGTTCTFVQRPEATLSGPDTAHLIPGGAGTAIILRPTTPDLPGGRLYRVLLYADLEAMADTLYVTCQYNDQNILGTNGTPELFWDGVSKGFQFWHVGFFTSTPASRNFRLTLWANGGLGFADVNTVIVQESFEMARSRWLAHEALVTTLKTIQGGVAFHTNLGQRVFHRFINPRVQQVPFPYVCVPLAMDQPVITDMQNLVKVEWTVQVYGFVGETDSAENATTAVRDALHLGEDIYQAILLNRDLSGTVHAVEIMDGGESIAGVDSEMWGEVRIPLKLTLYADANDLKP